MKKILILFALAIPLLARAYKLQYDQNYLARMGIYLPELKIVAFSGNDRVLVAIEKVTRLAIRAKGTGWVLRVFSLGQDDDIRGARSVLLPATDIDNAAVSDDGRIAIVIAQYGTEILEINLPAGKLKTIFKHETGKPGFRSDKRLCWYHAGSFYTQGYFYDKEGYWISDAVARLDLSHPNSAALFKKTWDIGQTEKALGRPQMGVMISGNQGFLGLKASDSSGDIMAEYYNNGKVTSFDKAKAYGGWAATDHRILYAALREDGKRDLIIRDTQSGKAWTLSSGATAYLYPYLSRDGGKVAVVATIDFKRGTMSYFYAKEKNNFNLKPIEDLQNIPIGIFRLSPDGKHYAFLNRAALTLGDVP